MNVEANLILGQSQFKSLDGVSSDTNSGYLFHFRTDLEEAGIVFGLDGLTTSGVADSRSGTSQILGKRKNFAFPNPSSAYLLTVATNDGGDDATGSLRTTTANNPGRLDLDEGLRLGILIAEKQFGEKFSTMIRYGSLKSAVARQSTSSDDYGYEADIRLRYRSTEMTSWTLEY